MVSLHLNPNPITNLGTLQMGQTTTVQISEYAITFESIIKKVREYGDEKDREASMASNGILSSPFADSADLCSNKLIN